MTSIRNKQRFMVSGKRALQSLLVFSCLALSAGASAQGVTLPLWPHGTPQPPQTDKAEANVATAEESAKNGYAMVRISNVTVPTLTVMQPSSLTDTPRAAALVFPGGGYARLSVDIEGEQTCQWLNSLGMVCVLVKYHVPEKGYYPDNPTDLEDAQQAMRLTRLHAKEWHIDPARLGVVGFSAGGNLAVLISTHPDDAGVMSTPAAADVPMRDGKPEDASANFAIDVYPAYLGVAPALHELNATYTPNKFTPPTFLVAAEDDHNFGPNSLLFYRALMDAKIPAELHMFPDGGHGFGTRPAATKSVANWTKTAEIWLHTVKILP